MNLQFLFITKHYAYIQIQYTKSSTMNPQLKSLSLFALFSISFVTTASNSVTINTLVKPNSHQLKIIKNDHLLYHANTQWSASDVVLNVSVGHQTQRGKIVINRNSVSAFNELGEPLWQDDRLDNKVCLPELFAEFIRANLTELKKEQSITCVGPVLKAKKLAPFKVTLLSQTPEQLIVNIGPGSFGMWFFMDNIELILNNDATYVLAYKGITPAPSSLSGKMSYLNMTASSKVNYPIAKIENTILW